MNVWKRFFLLALAAGTLTIAAAAMQENPVMLEDLPLEGQPVESEAAPEYPTGISGEAVWTLKDGTMYITGQGIFSGPANADNHPWEYFEEQIRHVVVEDGVTVVGDLAFAHTYNLETVTIADSVTEICEGAFRNCYGLKSVKLPAKLETLGNFVFAYCEKLESAELPDTLTKMGESVFTGCSAMTRVKLPGELYDIQQMNFDSCMALTEVTIPAGVGFLRHASFPDCFNLKKVVFEGNQPNTNGDPFYRGPEDLVVYCYSDAAGWDEPMFYTYPVVKLDRATGLPVGELPSGGEKVDDVGTNIPSGGASIVETPTDAPGSGEMPSGSGGKTENDGGNSSENVPQEGGAGDKPAGGSDASGGEGDKSTEDTASGGAEKPTAPVEPPVSAGESAGVDVSEEPDPSGSVLPAAGAAVAALLCGCGAAVILRKGKKTKK